MKTICRTEGEKTYFIIADADVVYLDTIRELEFQQVEDGFAKTFPAATMHMDTIYQNFARHAEELILQTAGIHPVPWEQALLALIQRIEQRQDINWLLVGSTALAVRGIEVSPRDIDLVLDDVGAHQVGDLLSDYLIEPVQDSRGWISNWFGRAFLHARVEWIGGVDANIDSDEVTDYGPMAASRLETINWRGYKLQVPPLDLQLQVSERRGLAERVKKIRNARFI